MEECGKHCELVVTATENEQRSKSNTKRIDKLEERVDNVENLAASMAAMAQKQEHMDTDIKEIKQDVKAIVEKPGKRWDKAGETIFEIVLAAVFGFLLARLGLG